MKLAPALLVAAAIPLSLLGACSKSGDTPAAAPAATADNAGSTAGQGGAVSGPTANGAVNTDGNTTNTAVAPASNSFTKDEAKGHIEKAGYTDVSDLTKTPDGIWTAKAMQDGKSVDVALDFKGAVTAQ
jgi:hypothetical protein